MYVDERYCEHCQENTMQKCVDSEHERDSSADWEKCLTCGWEYHGMTGKREYYDWSSR